MGPGHPSGDCPAKVGLFENVKILVAAGANINTHHEQYQGYTAPGKALVPGRFDIAVWLLE